MLAHPPRTLPSKRQVALAALTGLLLRLLLVLRFPAPAGDSAIYEELASNWLHAHVYGLVYANGLVPSDMRVPGYPAFLAIISLLIGRGGVAFALAQAILDLGTCFLVAWLASQLVPAPHRRRIALAALWLAVTCPFVANYAAVVLPEVLATFLTAAALIPLVRGCVASADLDAGAPAHRSSWNTWFAAGLLAGLGTLVRPETPLLLAALIPVIAFRWRRRADWGKFVRAVALAGAGLLLPLLPWGVRNWVRFHQVQFLAPRYAASPDEYTPRGLYAWTGTWLMRFRDVYLVPWNVGSDRVQLGDIPPAAFDSPDERARVAALLDRYNARLQMTPEIDRAFAELARERTARHPLRTVLFVPLGRAATLWFTPRTELLPISGHLWPLRQQWHDDPVAWGVTALLGALNFFYVGLALAGLLRALREPGAAWRAYRGGLALLVAFTLLRTAFLTQVETPEPRYVLECFPAVLALGAMCWLPRSPSSASPLPRAVRGES